MRSTITPTSPKCRSGSATPTSRRRASTIAVRRGPKTARRDGIDWLRKRDAVPRKTPTFTFNQDAANVRHAARVEESSNLQDWFGGNRRIAISEDVIGLGSYGKTLTVLYDINLPEPEEEEDEAALIESWTPRFRR